jgi:hypothetical protein
MFKEREDHKDTKDTENFYVLCVLVVFLAISFMQDQNSCHASDLGLKRVGGWAGPISNTSSPNEVNWTITIYDCQAHPEMLAAYLVIKRSSTLRSSVASRPVTLPGKKIGEEMVFQFPLTRETFKARKMADNSLEIIKEDSGKQERFSLPSSDQGSDLVIYGEACEEWKHSIKSGEWSQVLWQE